MFRLSWEGAHLLADASIYVRPSELTLCFRYLSVVLSAFELLMTAYAPSMSTGVQPFTVALRGLEAGIGDSHLMPTAV